MKFVMVNVKTRNKTFQIFFYFINKKLTAGLGTRYRLK